MFVALILFIFQLSCQLSYRKCVGILDLSISLVLLFLTFELWMFTFLCVHACKKMVGSIPTFSGPQSQFLLSSFKDLDGQNYRTMDITIENG